MFILSKESLNTFETVSKDKMDYNEQTNQYKQMKFPNGWKIKIY